MGFLAGLFGAKPPQHPPLEADSPVANRMARHQASLDALAGKVRDALEAVPGDRTLYVFIGKPPEAFGIVWFDDGQEESLRTIMKSRGLPQARVQQISDDVREVYSRHLSAPRFAASAGGKPVRVTDSTELCAELDRVISEVAAT